MKLKITLIVFFVWMMFQGKTQSFVIHDVLVSSQNARICDIEIDPYGKRICWQSPDDNKLWVCHLDTITWALTVLDGKEILIDSTLTPIDRSSNSGEWGYDQNGTYIVYNKEYLRKAYIALAAEIGSTWSVTTLMDAPHRMNPHATQTPGDAFVAIHYISTFFANYTKYKFINEPTHEYWVHDFKDAHWAQDQQLLTGILKNNHQVGLYDPANPTTPVQLTFHSGTEYSRPYLWYAPEHGNSRMLFAVANGEVMNVFKETTPYSNDFQIYMSFPSPSANPVYNKIGSPEPCVYDGQSYITFMVSSTECETSCFPGEIWIAKIDSLAPFFRMISDPAPGIRSDPESFATQDSLLVYYTEVNDTISSTPLYLLKKCDTGIGVMVSTHIDETSVPVDERKIPFPNPFQHHIAIKNAVGNEHFRLTDKSGRTIWRGKHIERKDFSELAPGIYFLKVSSGNSIQVSELIKE
jgi:hypothetical protein